MARSESVIDIREWRESIGKETTTVQEHDLIMAQLQAAFQSYLPVPFNLEPTLNGALRYLLDHPGSMVRPRLVYRIATTYGVDKLTAIDLAVALEYFHTASLLFDDLPCMDNASMRRGAPCVHLAYGESGAILAALALINRAYSLVWQAVAASPIEIRRSALRYLERHLGVHGLLNGQSLDLNYQSLPHTLASTERVASGKTVSLIAVTLILPAMVGGASRREVQLLERISRYWGLAYQVVDDLKDVLEDPSTIGKTTARDASLDRPNIVLAIGIPASLKRLTRLMHAGDYALERLLAARRSFVFLREFRDTLQEELNRVIESAGSMPIDRAQ